MKTVFANTIGSRNIRTKLINEKETLYYCGGNTGNVCFVDAIECQLNTNDEISCYDILKDDYKDKIYVLPASNWINLDGHVLRDIFLPLEGKDVKLAVLGIGVQLEIVSSLKEFVKELNKNKDTIKALKIIGEHSSYIGVRGAVTAECLDKIGIHNWKIIGCPSFYEPYRKMGTINISTPSLEHVVINVTPGRNGECKILEYGCNNQHSTDIILQDMNDMPLTLWEDRDVEERHVLRKFPGIKNVTAMDLTKYIRNKGRIFYTRETWSNYLKKSNVTFSFGSRFHGNMMALSNGIPALWVVHDIRTKEMIEAMHLPFVSYEDINEEDIINKCKYDSTFICKYRKMGGLYVDFLDECGIEHTFLRRQS
jgi:hypothetical protein